MTQRPQWLLGGTHGRGGTGVVESPRVLFVCTGNICRSALAACYFGAQRQIAGVTVYGRLDLVTEVGRKSNKSNTMMLACGSGDSASS